jgi:hypothetical protein
VSFLDNLENNLKALESQEQGGIDESRRRDLERARSLAAAPWAEQLKNGPYTKVLMGVATRAGFSRRVKVHLVWIGTTLRLEAGDQRLEFRPGAKGVSAVFVDQLEDRKPTLVDLAGDPEVLINSWMKVVDARRKVLAEQAAAEAKAAEELEAE